jgi:hypothetical protein
MVTHCIKRIRIQAAGIGRCEAFLEFEIEHLKPQALHRAQICFRLRKA